ncbi:hypothetical protein SAMD00019534_001070, partial [Acytostelium subglobosum LB1]|uniref:hypothetical protein n=1 Tax=Acytostelium subglobosum LB1 TaxID=1410327 RepID=UPI000644E31B
SHFEQITLIGFFFIIASYLITCWYTPDFQGEAPKWTYLFHTLCIFIYQTMDALDGKQARRTNSSSGLGELFDHGCDAITTFLVVITFLTSIQAGANTTSLYNVMIILTAFYFTQWEQYHTDVMELGYIGVTEGHIFMMLGHMISFVFGPSIWFTEISIKQGRIVLARICHDDLFPFQLILFPLIVPLVSLMGYVNLFALVPETLFLQVYYMATMAIYFHFAYVVVTTLCRVLNIRCFTLKKTIK